MPVGFAQRRRWAKPKSFRLNIADWIILLVILISVIQAASSGFFQEAFGIAGLVFGYLIAAWQYRNLGGHFVADIDAHWSSEIVAFLAISNRRP